MSWKNVKEHYRIGHQVHITPEGICIGSPYIHNLIVIGLDGAIKKRDGFLGNSDLMRYVAEMDADPAKLRELVTTPDTFAASIQVFTYDGGEILEKQCEALGWPNVTHDGCLQYVNMFSPDRAQVVVWAKRNSEHGIKLITELVEQRENDLAKSRQSLADEKAILAKLDRENPLIDAEKSAQHYAELPVFAVGSDQASIVVGQFTKSKHKKWFGCFRCRIGENEIKARLNDEGKAFKVRFDCIQAQANRLMKWITDELGGEVLQGCDKAIQAAVESQREIAE